MAYFPSGLRIQRVRYFEWALILVRGLTSLNSSVLRIDQKKHVPCIPMSVMLIV